MSHTAEAPRFARAYYWSSGLLDRTLVGVSAGFTGLWLAMLSHDRRHAVDKVFYDGEGQYQTAEYNRGGLSGWEQEMIGRHFGDCRQLLLTAAGGGREVLALRRLGYDVDASECHPSLVAFANELLHAEGFEPTVRLAPRDGCPDPEAPCQGAIVGWGAYMLIRGRARRVAFLRQIRERLPVGAPLLVSFFARGARTRHFRIAAALGNRLAPLFRTEPVELGDFLVPNFVHYFTQPEISGELAEAGFALVSYAAEPYGHAVAIAR